MQDFLPLGCRGSSLFFCLEDAVWVLLSVDSRASLCHPDYPGTFSVDQAGHKLTEIFLPSASRVLALKVCTTTTWLEDGVSEQTVSAF